MPLIHVYFFQPPSDDPHWINHIVRSYDPPYSHCDVQFEDLMASSVYQNEPVYFRARRFRKPGYVRKTIPVSQYQYDKAYKLCRTRAGDKMGFDAVGMYSLPLPSALLADRANKTFCSKHVAEVLQEAGVRAVTHLNSRELTPSALYRALEGASIFHVDSTAVAGLRI